jgi:uncharacterized protein YbjQ (UPF0145 family)
MEQGGLASSTEKRLQELTAWGGSTSFLSPTALTAAADIGVHPIGQVVGLSAGVIRHGYVRPTHSGQGRMRVGVARWREHSGPPRSWSTLRRRALARLTKQALMLGANAVVGIGVEREREQGGEEGVVSFSGTAVRIDTWRSRNTVPVLTLASAQELWAMLRSGIEPVGIAGGFARIETLPSKGTVAATMRWRRTPNVELPDLTEAVYEARRLALERLIDEASSLNADGLIGIDLKLEEPDGGFRPAGLTVTVDLLASAVRRVGRPSIGALPVVSLSEGPRG